MIDGFGALGQDIQFEPQLPGGEPTLLPVRILDAESNYITYAIEVESGKFYQVRYSSDLIHWRREYVSSGTSSAPVVRYLNLSYLPDRQFVQVVQFEEE